MKVSDIVMSSFVYSGSSRKAAILAAATNPINTELVTQLVRYLDEEYLKPKEEFVRDDSENGSTEASGESATQLNLSPPSNEPSFSGSDHFESLASMFGDDVELPEESAEPEEESEPEVASAEPEVASAEPEEESAKPEEESEPEVASSTNATASLEDISASIASTLNAVDTTSGVRSAKVLGTELWIYYKDNINLNSVMESVIDAVASHELEFNRLARSHNAIVFTSI